MAIPGLSGLRAAAIGREQARNVSRNAAEAIRSKTGEWKSFIRVADDPAPNDRLESEALLGCLFSVKDNIDVAGLPTTCGSRLFADGPPAAGDAWIVDALRSAGATFLGKNNMDELALSGTGVNPLYGTIRNPWDQTRGVGGSSGGSALAVALRQVHLAIGTDSGGSVRMPASMCGVVGFKPTPGILPIAGVRGAAWTIDCLGLFTGNVADLALVWSAIRPAGQATEIASPRLAYLQDESMGRASPKVWGRYVEAVESLRRAGVDLTGISIGGLQSSPQICVSIVYPEVASAHDELMRKRPELYDPAILALFYLGELWSGRHYLDAQRLRTLLAARFARLIQPFDAVLIPTVAVQPPRIGEPAKVEGDPPGSELYTLMRFIVPFNVIGYPAMSVPAGFDADGLPVGIQLVGRPHSDDHLIEIAKRIEAVLGTAPEPPTLLGTR